MKNAFETISSQAALKAAWTAKRTQLASSCFGVDRVGFDAFKHGLPSRLKQLSERLRSGLRPHGLLAISKPKDNGGVRIICVPTLSDRLVQFGILEHLRPRLARLGLDNAVSFGLVPGRARSVIGARQFACGTRAERGWVYKTDIHKFFDNVDRNLLRASIRSSVPIRSLWTILDTFLDTEISDGFDRDWRKIVASAGIKNGIGVRQGMPLSPFYAGVYLRDFDKWLIKNGIPAARYVDDVVAFFKTEAEARMFHPLIAAKLESIGLKIGDMDDPTSKTKLYAPNEAADFLGMEIRETPRGYQLFVSDKTISAIEAKLTKLASAEAMFEKGIVLTTLGSYLSALSSGYKHAYDGAHNHDAFVNRILECCEDLKRAVLLELFGDRVDDLSSSQRRFVGID